MSPQTAMQKILMRPIARIICQCASRRLRRSCTGRGTDRFEFGHRLRTETRIGQENTQQALCSGAGVVVRMTIVRMRAPRFSHASEWTALTGVRPFFHGTGTSRLSPAFQFPSSVVQLLLFIVSH